MRKIYEQALEVVHFSGGELEAFKNEKGRIWVQAKPVAKALGLKWHGQLEHLQRDEALRDSYYLKYWAVLGVILGQN